PAPHGDRAARGGDRAQDDHRPDGSAPRAPRPRVDSDPRSRTACVVAAARRGPVMAARTRSTYSAHLETVSDPRVRLVKVTDPEAGPEPLPVWWRMARTQRWHCAACGPQARAECPH